MSDTRPITVFLNLESEDEAFQVLTLCAKSGYYSSVIDDNSLSISLEFNQVEALDKIALLLISVNPGKYQADMGPLFNFQPIA